MTFNQKQTIYFCCYVTDRVLLLSGGTRWPSAGRASRQVQSTAELTQCVLEPGHSTRHSIVQLT